MKIKELIKVLEDENTFINYNKSKDKLIFGDENQEIKKVGVCWVATNKAIKQATENGINFIISHENCFYNNSTGNDRLLDKAIKNKKNYLSKNNISVYRCHDLWDLIPDVGVSDTWANLIEVDFQPRQTNSYNHYGKTKKKLIDLVETIKQNLKPYGQNGVIYIGDKNSKIHKVGLGTGACCDIFEMERNGCDCFIVSDDSITNWIEVQYAVDSNIPMIIVTHAACEICGIHKMPNYFKERLGNIPVDYLDEGIMFNFERSKEE